MGSLNLTTNILIVIGKKAACLTVKPQQGTRLLCLHALLRHAEPVYWC